MSLGFIIPLVSTHCNFKPDLIRREQISFDNQNLDILYLPLLRDFYAPALCISHNKLIIKNLIVKIQGHHQYNKALKGHILLFIEQYFLKNIKGL